MAGKYSSKKFILPFYVFSTSIPLHSRVLLPSKKNNSSTILKKTLLCLCFSIVLNLSRGCFLRYKTMNSFPRTFRSNPLKLFRINILFPSFYFFVFSLEESKYISHLVFTIFLLLFQIKVYYRRSAFADMKKNCSFSGDLSLSLKRGRLWCKSSHHHILGDKC